MNTIQKTALVASSPADTICINCGADYNTNTSPECPCCGLHHREMTCMHCGENFAPPEEHYYEHDQTCPHCGESSFRPFYFKEITEYPLTEGSYGTQYPATDYPEIPGETTDYPFENNEYPFIFNFSPVSGDTEERIIISGREYSFDIASLEHEGNARFLRLRGMRLLCDTSRFAAGTNLRLLLRDRRSSQFVEREITLEQKKRESCLFDFGSEDKYYTKDIAVSFKLLKDGQECARELPVVPAFDSSEVRWDDKFGNTFTPALTLYGYTKNPYTGEHGLFYATTAYPMTGYPTTGYPTTEYPTSEYPTTEYPDSSSSSEYADWEYPAGGTPAIVPMTFMYEADFWHLESVRGQVERRTLPSVSLPLEHVVFEEDTALDIRLVDIAMAPEVVGNRSLQLWVDDELWANISHSWSNPVLMRMFVEDSRPNWEERLAKVPTIEIKAADGQDLDFFFDRTSGKPIASITGVISGLPTEAYPTTGYPTTAYLSSEYSSALSPMSVAFRAAALSDYPAVYDYETLSSSSFSSSEAGPGAPDTPGSNDISETPGELYACPTVDFPSPGNTGTEEGEAGTEESFGGGDDGSGLPSGNISMISPRLNVEMASPSVLKYRHISQRRVGGFNSPTGLIEDATQVCLFTERGFPRFTDFSQSSAGERADRSLTLPEQLRKITIETDDGSGLPVQTSCFEEILGDGTLLRYSLETGEVVAMKAYKGSWVTADKLKEDLDIVYENEEDPTQPVSPVGMSDSIYSASAGRSGRIRQIWSRRDGLLDIVILSDTSYEIRWYASADVGLWNESQRLYGIRSGASPVKVWTVDATLIEYEVRSDGKKYEIGTDRLLSEEDLKYLRKLRVTEQRGDLCFVSEWEQPDSATLIFTRGEGEDAETTVTHRTATDPATYAELVAENLTLDASYLRVGETLTREIEETRTVPGVPGGTKTRVRRYPFGDVVVFREEGTGSEHPSTVTYEYDTDAESRTYGCCITETSSSGKIVTNNYDALKRLVSRREPWAGGTSRITYYTYDNREDRRQQATSVTECLIVEGREKAIAKTSYAYSITPELHEEKVTRIGLGSPGVDGIPQPEISLTQWYGPDPETNGQECSHAAGRLKMRRDAAGVQYDYLYVDGASSGVSYICFVTQTYKGDQVRKLSTSVAHYYDELGREVRKCEYVHTGERFTLVDEEKYTFDSAHRIIRTDKLNGTHTETSWICKGPLLATDEYGVQTHYEYNSAKKLLRETQDAVPYVPQPGAPVQSLSLPSRVTEYLYDAAGRETARKVTMGNKVTMTSREWDALGRVSSQTDESGRTTLYEYSADGLETTSVTPTGATLVTRYHLDGNVLSETGTGRQACYYSYSCNNWELETRIRLDTPSGPLVKELFTGGKGQTLYTREARGEYDLISSLSRYDSAGRLAARQEAGHPEVQMNYDHLGNVIRETVCRNSPWRNLVNVTEKSYELKSLSCEEMGTPWPAWAGTELVWLRTVHSSFVEGEQGNAITETRWELVSKELSNIQEALVAVDKYGRQTAVWKETPSGNEYQYVFQSGGTECGCTMSLQGRTVWERSTSGERRSYAYEWLASGERISTTDGRGNTEIREMDLSGRAVSVTDGDGNKTRFDYDPATGLLVCYTNAVGGTVEYQYDNRGRLMAQYGTAAQPLRFDYDEADRMTALYTWRVPSGTLSSSPMSRTDGDITRWTYNASSGVLLEKRMADGSCTSYKYNNRGQIVFCRQPGEKDIYYSYDGQTDLLRKIRYSDDTPGVTFTRNDWGDILSVSDGAGSRQYHYDNLREMDEETVSAPCDARLCAFRDEFGRESGYRLLVNEECCQKVNLTYGDDLRLGKVVLNDTDVYQYGWQTAAGLPSTITGPHGIVKEWTYEENRNNVAAIRYTLPGGGTLLSRENAYDELGRLTYRRDPGDGNRRHDYAYNARSEVTGDTLSGGSHWTYSYDNLGNRIVSGGTQGTRSYGTNHLNQYTDITGPDNSGMKTFRPVYDSCGNQTLVETDTGEWQVKWNAENRPIVFTKGDERVECLYDFMGRRTRKIHTKGGEVISRKCYVYKGYKLVAELDAKENFTHPDVAMTWLWDPSRNEDATPLEVTDWKREEEYPETDYPETEYPTTEYPTTAYPETEYPDSSYPAKTFFVSADLMMVDRKEGAFIITTYEDEGLFVSFDKTVIPEGKAACIDRIELALDGTSADLTSFDYKATVHFPKSLTVYPEWDGDVLHLDLTGQTESVNRVVPLWGYLNISLERREKNTPDGNWTVCKEIPYYINSWTEPSIKHVSGVLIDRSTLPPTEYPETEYPATDFPTTEYSTTEYPTLYEPRFDFYNPSTMKEDILYQLNGYAGEIEKRWVDSVSMPLSYQSLSTDEMFEVESICCASDHKYVHPGNASITLGGGLYHVTAYAYCSDKDLLYTNLKNAGVHEELRTVTTSYVDFRMTGVSQFPAWFDRETGQPVGQIMGRVKKKEEYWEATTAYPTTDFPETEYPTTEFPTLPYPQFDFDRPSLLPENILYLQKGRSRQIEKRYVDSVQMRLDYQNLPERHMFVLESINCASAEDEVQSGNSSITMGDGLYQVTTYVHWEVADVLCADMEKGGVPENTRTVEISNVDFRLRGVSQFPVWFDQETGRPIGLITGRVKEVWGETTDYPSDIDSDELSNETINNQQTKINMKTNVINGTATAVPSIRTRKAMANRVRETDEPRMEPPYPTYYPDTEYPTRFPDSQFFTYMPDTLWYRDKEEGEKEECHLVTSEIVVDFEGEAGEGGNCVVDMVEIVVNKGASALDDDALTAEMILDGKEPEMVQVTKPRINVYRMDLQKAGIPESRRTLKGKREIMIRLKEKGITGKRYLIIGSDNKKRPYAHVMGHILPLPQPRDHYYCQTDHNKNVTGLADSTGSPRATWDYDAFGNSIAQSGDKAAWNPLRYSSEYHDQELGLIYYNYRHYNPRDGRWISRDLIEESGGLNLYIFVRNSSLVSFDFLGEEEVQFFEKTIEAMIKAMELVADATKRDERAVQDVGGKIKYEQCEHGARVCCNKNGFYVGAVGSAGFKTEESKKESSGAKGPDAMGPLLFPLCNQDQGKRDKTAGLVHSHPKGSRGGLSGSDEKQKNGTILGDMSVVLNGVKVGGEKKDFTIPANIPHAVVVWEADLFNKEGKDKWRGVCYNGNGKKVLEYIKRWGEEIKKV